jgi:hypothetical protein
MVEGTPTQQLSSYWRKPNNYIRILTLLAVGTYTIFQIIQTHLIESNNVVSQRAFVSISYAGEFVSLDQSQQPLALNMIASFTDGGNTATRDLVMTIKCAASVEDLTEPWPLLHQGRDPGDRVPIFIGPHGSETGGCSFDFDQIRQMAAAKLYGYLLVDSSYHDRIDQSIIHATQKALKLAQVSIQPGPPVSVQELLVAVGKHNCADEECPKD